MGREAVFGSGNVKVFGELVAVFDAADGTGDLVFSVGAAAVGDLVGELAKCRLGGAQQILALAGPLLGEQRVLADDQAFAGKVGGRDLGQIALVKQRELESTGVEQRPDLWGPERGDPVEPGRPQFFANTRASDHPAVPTSTTRQPLQDVTNSSG